MSDEKRTEKFQLMMTPSEIEAIDDWGFKQRIRTRAEAIRRLCQIGLVATEYSAEALALTKPSVFNTVDLLKKLRDQDKIDRKTCLDILSNLMPLFDALFAILAVEEARGSFSNPDLDVNEMMARIKDLKKEIGEARAERNRANST